MRLGYPLLSVLAALGLVASAHASPPQARKAEDMTGRLERQFGIRQPGWKGAAPAKGSPSYDEALAVLRALLERRPGGAPDRLATAPPCVLHVVRADDFAARGPNSSIGLLYQSTWIDLRQVTGIAAETFGRDPKKVGRMVLPTPGETTTFGGIVATCAFFRGAPGFARWTQVFTLPGQSDPAYHAELEDEPGPRICVRNDVEADELAGPLRQLAALCGGQPEPVSLNDVPESPNPRKGLEAMRRMFLAQDVGRLERVVAHDPANGEAWAQLGKAYHETGRLQDAAAAYAKALAIRPKNAVALKDRGDLYRAMGNSDEALENYRRAFEADSRQRESLLNVGLVHAYDLHQPEEAASAWSKLYALDPQSELAARARWEIGKLGDRYARGDGMPQDWARANALFEKSCDLGETQACAELAASFAIGRGVPPNAATVEALRKKACELGDERACGKGK